MSIGYGGDLPPFLMLEDLDTLEITHIPHPNFLIIPYRLKRVSQPVKDQYQEKYSPPENSKRPSGEKTSALMGREL